MTTLNLPLENRATAPFSTLAPTRSRAQVWTGRGLSGFIGLFLAWDAAMKLIQHPMAVEGTVVLGYPPHTLLVIGVLEAVCLVLYAVPRTAVLGAVLWTGYLGGAIATHLRLENPLFTHTLFPIYVAAFLWGGLALRDARVLALLAAPRRPERAKGDTRPESAKGDTTRA